MNQRLIRLILIGVIQVVHSAGSKGIVHRGPLKIESRKFISNREEVDDGLWFKGNYGVPLVDEKLVAVFPPVLPPNRRGCSLKSGILPPGVTCSPSRNPSLVPSFLSPSTVGPTTHQSVSPSGRPTLPPMKAPTERPSMLPTFSAIPSSSNYPSTIGPTSHPSVSPSGRQTLPPTKALNGRTTSAIPSVSNYPSSLPTKSAAPTRIPTKSPATQSYLAPSRFPTNGPTTAPSNYPTSAPNLSPLKAPVKEPSKGPSTASRKPISQVPILSSQSSRPSSLPVSLPKPSSVPNSPPSTYPTSPPNPSPLKTPVKAPSKVPSTAPSNPISKTPILSSLPSSLPRPSSLPNSLPNLMPTARPSRYLSTVPSSHPSRALPSAPSQSPSKSAAPTVLLFNTQPTTGSNGDVGENSTCLNGPPSSSPTAQAQVLTFAYNVYLSEGASTGNQTGPIESRLQKALAYYYLKCKFNRRQLQGSGFYVVQVLSLPMDTLSSTPCSANETISNATCYVVNGGITVDLLFSNTRTAVNILSSFGAFLASEMDGGRLNGGEVVGLNFLGFTNVGGASGTLPDTTASAAQQGATSNSSSSRSIGIIAGSAAVAAAVLVLLMLLFLVYRRKRGDGRQVYLKQDEDLMDEIAGDEETDLGTEMNMKSIVVNDDDENSFSNSVKGIKLVKKNDEGDLIEKYGHVHKCAASSCEICQNAKRPTFVTADWREIRDQLGPQRHSSKPRQYIADDTVDL